jgi:hypothetical protein
VGKFQALVVEKQALSSAKAKADERLRKSYVHLNGQINLNSNQPLRTF